MTDPTIIPGVTPMTEETQAPSPVGELVERLRAIRDSGRRTMGGGTISSDGRCEMWGVEPIMVAVNPDGAEAADRIEALTARVKELEEALQRIEQAPTDPTKPGYLTNTVRREIARVALNSSPTEQEIQS